MLRLVGMLLMLLLAGSAYAQTASDEGRGTLLLRTRLEKTILRLDVLDLELQFGEDASFTARRWMAGGEWSDALADSMAFALAHATDATAEIRFLRNVGLKRFLKSIDDSMGKAVRVGWLSPADFGRISRQLPGSYSFLADDGIRDGDRILYSVRGDSLRVRYVDGEGRERLDQTDVGPERRIALLGSYFAPGSDFRDGLLRSAREGR